MIQHYWIPTASTGTVLTTVKSWKCELHGLGSTSDCKKLEFHVSDGKIKTPVYWLNNQKFMINDYIVLTVRKNLVLHYYKPFYLII